MTEPEPARADYRGLVPFVFSALCAAVSLYALLGWWHLAGKDLTDYSGGTAFSMNIVPLLAEWVGMALAFPAAGLLVISVCMKERKEPLFSTFHVISMVLLLPAAFLILHTLDRLL